MIVSFDVLALQDYNQWAVDDIKLFLRIGALIKDICRDPYRGLGKPEPLKHNYTGYWSRRITDEHRLIYKYSKDSLYIVSCKYHYK